MNTKIHNLSLRGITGIFAGIISFIYIYRIQLLLSQYTSGSASVSMLPISFFELLVFGISFLYILISYFTIVLINKRRRKKLYLRKWGIKAKRIRRVYLTFLLLGGIIIYFLLANGLLKIVIPASLILYGISGVISNKYTFGATAVLGIGFLLNGILALLFPNLAFYLWGLAFGGYHMVYGLFYFIYKR